MSPRRIELDRFYACELARGLKPGTIAAYRHEVGELLAFLASLGKEDLREATTDDLVAYLAHLDRKGLASLTVAYRLGRLRRFFAYFHRSGVLFLDPATDLRRRQPPRRLRAWLTEEETKRLLEQPDVATPLGLRNRAALELLYSSGLRIGELLALELDDLDLGEGYATVRTSKTGRGRRVRIGRVATSWVARYVKEVRPQLARRRSLLLFVSTTGRALPPRRHRPSPRRLCGRGEDREAGLSACATRHSFAVHLLRNGASTRHIQDSSGTAISARRRSTRTSCRRT